MNERTEGNQLLCHPGYAVKDPKTFASFLHFCILHWSGVAPARSVYCDCNQDLYECGTENEKLENERIQDEKDLLLHVPFKQ
jgi:hypothetical protein